MDSSSSVRRVRFSSPGNQASSSSISVQPDGELIGADEIVVFNTSKIAGTPSINRAVKYKEVKDRNQVSVAPQGTLSRPNYEDILKRVSVVIHQHVIKCEMRMENTEPGNETGLFHHSKLKKFSEANFLSPQFVYHFIRMPIARLGFTYGIRKLPRRSSSPSLNEIHNFLINLFVRAQLSAECSIVCLIYVERLMENSNVPLVAETWRPCLLCGLLLASKVWQDLSSWNSEISTIYPEYSIKSINKLEREFCQEIKWDLYISSSLYAKYYFALRSLTEKKDFRRKYNAVMLVNAPGAAEVAERSGEMKESVLATVLSRSL